MTAVPGSVSRLERGVCVGLLSGLGALVAHAFSGGHLAPSTSVVVLASALAAGLALSRRRPGIASLLALAAGAQLASHVVLATAAGPSGHAGMAGMHHAGGGLGMLLAHLGVALVTVAACRGADDALLGLARSLVRRLFPLVRPGRGPAVAPRLHHRLDTSLLPVRQLVLATPTTRGPPPAPVLL